MANKTPNKVPGKHNKDVILLAIKQAKKKQGISGYQLAKMTGCSESAISLFLNEKRRPTIYASKMLTALGLKIVPK